MKKVPALEPVHEQIVSKQIESNIGDLFDDVDDFINDENFENINDP